MSNNNVVRCEICQQEMATISWKHLLKHSLTLAEYTKQFPDSPIRSPASIERKRAGAAAANAGRKGVPRSPQVKQKISDTKSANPQSAWNKGIPRTPEQNQALSATRKAMFASGELTHWNTGRVCSEETKDKIRQTALQQRRVYTTESLEKRRITYANKMASGWVHHSTDTLINRLTPLAREHLNDPTWLYEQHITNKRTISSICVELGLHWKNSNRAVRAKLVEYDIPVTYWHQASSVQQREVEDFVTSLGIAIETRNRRIIAPQEVDIYIPDMSVAIEYCGLYWHTTEYKDPDYHLHKFEECAKRGIRLLTIYSDEWLNQRTVVESKIRAILNKTSGSSVYARKCSVRPVDIDNKRQFFATYHIQGNGPSSINIGLYHNEVLVACMGLVRQSDNTYTLNRYATATTVVGGFSKLLSHFIRTHSPQQIITFADRRWSVGGVYDSNGFVLDSVLPADYEYVDGELRIHKFNFRRKYLPTLLPDFDPTLSETANTMRAGIHRIYDCGKLRYVWTAPEL